MNSILRLDQDHQSERIPVGEAIMSSAEIQNLSTQRDVIAVGSDTMEFSHGGAPNFIQEKSPKTGALTDADGVQRSFSMLNRPTQKIIVNKEIPGRGRHPIGKTMMHSEPIDDSDPTKQQSASVNLTGHHSLMNINQHSKLIRGAGLLKRITGGEKEEEAEQPKKTTISETRKSIIKDGASTKTLHTGIFGNQRENLLKRVTEDDESRLSRSVHNGSVMDPEDETTSKDGRVGTLITTSKPSMLGNPSNFYKQHNNNRKRILKDLKDRGKSVAEKPRVFLKRNNSEDDDDEIFSAHYTKLRNPAIRSQTMMDAQTVEDSPLHKYKYLHDVGKGSYATVSKVAKMPECTYFVSKVISLKEIENIVSTQLRVEPERITETAKKICDHEIEISRLLKSLSPHPNICLIEESHYSSAEEKYYLYFLFAEHGTLLSEHHKRSVGIGSEEGSAKQLSMGQTKEIFRQLVSGIKYSKLPGLHSA